MTKRKQNREVSNQVEFISILKAGNVYGWKKALGFGRSSVRRLFEWLLSEISVRAHRQSLLKINKIAWMTILSTVNWQNDK